MEMIRAEKTAQQAGAYYVRIQAMARKHHISLEQEFDEHDTPETKYIVLIDDYLPVATCRLYPLDDERMMLGRIVVLPEYRGKGLGRMATESAEEWAKELGYRKAVLESREGKVGFYEKMGYAADYQDVIHGETFTCIHMEKDLKLRQTNYLEKINGEWKVLHEHTSMAADWDGTIEELANGFHGVK